MTHPDKNNIRVVILSNGLPDEIGKKRLIKVSNRAFIVGEQLSLTDEEEPKSESVSETRHQLNINPKPKSENFGSVAITFDASTKINTSNPNYDETITIECNGNARELI